jgi:hypothetical protein
VTANGYLVADRDMHVFEPADLWQRYIDPAWRHAAPVGLTMVARSDAARGACNLGARGPALGDQADGRSPQDRVEHLDDHGRLRRVDHVRAGIRRGALVAVRHRTA